MTLPLREELASVQPYGAPQLDVPVRLNVNENPYPPAPAVIKSVLEGVAEVLPTMNRYPDRDFMELRAALANYLYEEAGVTVEKERIWAANGSNEVMLHLLQAYASEGRTLLSFAPTYSMYHEYARDTGTNWVAGTRAADFKLDFNHVEAEIERTRPSILVLASPNNPTGTALTLEEARLLADLTRGSGPVIGGAPTDTVLVIDEAYGEFRREGTPSALTLLDEYPHVVVSRTMSKAFGMAGLRLGYFAAAREIVDHVMRVRLPYHLSATTQAVALAALSHSKELMSQVAHMRATRDNLVIWLRSKGLDVADSDANFVLFGKFADRERVFAQLLDRGVLIRVVGPEGYLRVSVGTDEEDARFRAALEEVL
ncbi:histidinol-phosphate transaminase [uncultured Actinomyces sp.]|uniref:histidinol-phosphate transaminase n=1 Tax=uncultured Actinomyces sp. TaxID=249061 RepID=UPI00262810DC|nr:histidinol-phosphate transaminase [uncultured Actinomyces sp.]